MDWKTKYSLITRECFAFYLMEGYQKQKDRPTSHRAVLVIGGIFHVGESVGDHLVN